MSMEKAQAFGVRYSVQADNSWDAFHLAAGDLSHDTQTVDASLDRYKVEEDSGKYYVSFYVVIPDVNSFEFGKAHSSFLAEGGV